MISSRPEKSAKGKEEIKVTMTTSPIDIKIRFDGGPHANQTLNIMMADQQALRGIQLLLETVFTATNVEYEVC